MSDGDSGKKLVQFFVVADGELQVTRVDSGLLVITSGVSGQFENFSGEVFKNGSEVDRGSTWKNICKPELTSR